MNYLLDTSVLIQAYHNYYAETIVPSFWHFISQEDNIFTLKEVQDEIKRKEDRLVNLVKAIKIFEYDALNTAPEVAQYINDHQVFSDESKSKFLQGADFWLVCTAKQHNCTVVTQEESVGQSSKKVKIPNVCRIFSVDYNNTFQMLQANAANLSDYS